MTEKEIWDFLYKRIGNPFGVAALMGNLWTESHLDSTDLQGTYERRLGMSNLQYTNAVDSGVYTRDDFIHDGAGYGLAQWTYWSRKESLYEYAKQAGKSIGDTGMQLEFLLSEIKSYKTVMSAIAGSMSVREISDAICKRYLKPAHQEEEYLINRADRGKHYYDLYASQPQQQSQCESASVQKQVVAKDNVNIRVGNGKAYARIGVMKAGTRAPWIATSENGWHAFAYDRRVCWVSGEFSEVQ